MLLHNDITSVYTALSHQRANFGTFLMGQGCVCLWECGYTGNACPPTQAWGEGSAPHKGTQIS